jgi:4a-hydroxytetrahydrobiopterin dehydratase
VAMDQSEIDERLAGLDGWAQEGQSITREFDRGDFVGSVKFIDAIVGPAEDLGHHPDLEISWATVKVTVTTHSEGGLTPADFELASRIDDLA